MLPRRFLLLMTAVALPALALAGCVSSNVQPVDPGATGVGGGDLERIVHVANGLPLAEDVTSLVPAEVAWRGLGHDAIEPTVGVTSTGTLFVAAAGFVDGTPMTDILRSRDGGKTWETVTPQLPVAGGNAPPETGDPYVYVDPLTDRVYSLDMFPALTCGYLSWSDDEGDSWTSNPLACGSPPPYDHQTFATAPSRGTPTVGYDTVAYYCVNRISDSLCHRSLDGGMTWLAGTPAFLGVDPRQEGGVLDGFVDGVCGGLHGHLANDAEGRVYLPREYCGLPFVAVSEDDGVTWNAVQVSEEPMIFGPDPAVAVDDAGNVYYAFVGETGALFLSVSTDHGRTWSPAVTVQAPGVTATHLPSLAAGGAGEIVLAYVGTENLPEGYANPEFDEYFEGEFPEDSEVQNATWNGYLAVIENALAEEPLIQSTRVNPLDDPLVRGYCGPGRCPGMYDFIDVVIGPDGRPFGAFVDACTGTCATPEGTAADNTGENMAFDGAIATFLTGPSLRGDDALPPLE